MQVSLAAGQSKTIQCRLQAVMPGVKTPTLLLSVTDVDETTASLSKSIQVDISEPFHINNSVTYSPLQHGRTPLLSLGNALEELYKADVVTTVALGAAAGEDIVIRKVRYVLSVSDESRGKGDAQLTAPLQPAPHIRLLYDTLSELSLDATPGRTESLARI